MTAHGRNQSHAWFGPDWLVLIQSGRRTYLPTAKEMRNYDRRQIAELAGIFAVVLSLLLGAFELRQSTTVAAAQAVFDTNTVHDQSFRARAQYPELDALVEKGHMKPASLSERERSQFFAWILADMNVIEAAWFFHDRGIIPQEDMK